MFECKIKVSYYLQFFSVSMCLDILTFFPCFELVYVCTNVAITVQTHRPHVRPVREDWSAQQLHARVMVWVD